MTDIEVITAASDSGLTYYGMGKDRAKFLHHLQAFAALVAAQEREACAKIADEWAVGWPHPSQVIAERIRERT